VKVLLCLLTLAAGGCASYSSRTAATTLEPGAREVGVALDVLVVERGREHVPLPLPEISYRRGVRPGLDIGGKLHLTGAEGSVRVALAERGRLRLAALAGLALGYEPVTNNTTDLLYARALPRLIAELAPGDPGGRWPALIAAATPSVTFAGPATIFAGVTGAARFILRPGAALATRWRIGSGRAFWLELNVQPAYAIGDGWLAPAFQGGAALSF
jgi:hypothetical protein